MDRRVSNGIRACTARQSRPRTSPPVGPTDVAPTSAPSRSDQLHEPFATVNPPARFGGNGLVEHAHVAAPPARLRLGQPDGADLGVGEGHPRHGPVVRVGAGPPQNVGHAEPGLERGDMGVPALPRHVADGPDARSHPHPPVHGDAVRLLVEAQHADPEGGEIAAPPRGHQQALRGHG